MAGFRATHMPQASWVESNKKTLGFCPRRLCLLGQSLLRERECPRAKSTANTNRFPSPLYAGGFCVHILLQAIQGNLCQNISSTQAKRRGQCPHRSNCLLQSDLESSFCGGCFKITAFNYQSKWAKPKENKQTNKTPRKGDGLISTIRASCS